MFARSNADQLVNSIALVLFSIVASLVVGRNEFFAVYGALVHNRDYSGIDIDIIWLAGTRLINHLSPYTTEALDVYRAQFGPGAMPYPYPPFQNILVAPLGYLSMNQAAAIAFILNAISYAGTIFLILRRYTKQSGNAYLLLVLCASFAANSAMETIYFHGNFAPMTLVLALWAAELLDLQRPGPAFAAGALVGLAVLLKLYLAILFVPIVLDRNWRCAIAGVAVIGLAAVLSSVALPLAFWMDWWTEISRGALYGTSLTPSMSIAINSNQSLNGFFARLLGDGTAQKAVTLVGAIFVLALSSLYVIRTKSRDSNTIFEQFSLFLAVMVLVAPLSWSYYAAYCLPVLAVILLHSWSSIPYRILAMALAVGWMLPWRPIINYTARQPFISLETGLFAMLWIVGLYFIWSAARRRVA